MSVITAYKSKQPDTHTAWLESCQAVWDQFRDQVHQWAEDNQLDVDSLSIRGTGFSHTITYYVEGYRTTTADPEPREGWRMVPRSDLWVPAKRTPQGKAIAKQLDALTMSTGAVPGFHELISGTKGKDSEQSYITSPTLTVCPPDVYATLPVIPRPPATPDPELWEPVKLSEYWAAVETQVG